MELEDIETDYPSIKALRKAADEFEVYIRSNAGMIPNYAERRRYGERVSTGFVESAINTVVGKRFGKRQQMRWSKGGAHLMLQARTRTLDGTLRGKFEQWYPGLKVGDGSVKAEQARCLIAPHFLALPYRPCSSHTQTPERRGTHVLRHLPIHRETRSRSPNSVPITGSPSRSGTITTPEVSAHAYIERTPTSILGMLNGLIARCGNNSEVGRMLNCKRIGRLCGHAVSR